MLMLQKAYAEACERSTSTRRRSRNAVRAGGPDARRAVAVDDLLLPIVKGVGSERRRRCSSLSLQTLGGSGYLQDYPSSSTSATRRSIRSTRGPTAIQSLDLLFRKIVRDHGRALGHVVEEIGASWPRRAATVG